jgi:hypothetical protein
LNIIDRYFEKAVETDITHEELADHPGLTISDEGFIVLERSGEDLILIAAFGDGEYWQDYAEEEGHRLGCKRILMATKRKPEAFSRKYGYKFLATMMEKTL